MTTPDDSAERIARHYDEQPYQSNAFFYAAPGHMRATAWLYGVDTAPLPRARVLELGCAAGGNLLPFALAYPDADVVGVDLSSVQIAAGQRAAKALGVTNLTLHAMSLTDIDAGFGQFDYIIAHGVFSWVPPEVRDAMLRICRENLSPQGMAYLSYNTYPGWKAGDIVRDAMLLHSHGAASEADKLKRAKSMLTLLSDGLAPSNPLAPSLRSAVKNLQRFSDYYITHEYLETFNTPCYFVEFVNAAQQAGLTYVGDAESQSELSATYGNNVQLHHSLAAMGEPKALRQQYLDFATGRNFRKSLVIAAEREADIQATPDLQRLADLHVAGQFQEIETNEQTPAGARSFSDRKGRQLHSRDPAVIAVMNTLTQHWPQALDLASLTAETRAHTGMADDAEHEQQVRKAVKTLYQMGRLHLTREPNPVTQAGDTPRLAPGYAALLTLTGATIDESGVVIGQFNVWYEATHLRLTPAEHWLVAQMAEGTIKPTALRTALRDALGRGQFPGPKGESLAGQRNLDATAQGMVQRLLDALRRHGLLMG